MAEAAELKIDSRIAVQSARAGIKNLIAGVVELVTNSDDSYKRLEAQGVSTSGHIEIFVSRLKGGRCRELWVKDFAESMTYDELKKAIIFGAETSGQEVGRSVRGFFGRGLKEAVISLGEGEIFTIKNGILNCVKIWVEGKDKAKYLLNDPRKISQQTRKKIGIENGDGTLVKINVKNPRMKIQEQDKFAEQVSNHYALRDICSSPSRKVLLVFESERKGGKKWIEISYTAPQGQLIFDREVTISGYREKMRVKIFKTGEPLDFSRYNPCSRAGILIKTEGAILDNRLFRYDNDPVAFYFFGEAFCEGIAKRIRKDETEIVDFNRAGLDWFHDYCKSIAEAIESAFEPLVEQKKKELEELEKVEKGKTPHSTKKMLNKLCTLLNKLARKEFLEWGPPVGPPGEIDKLMVVPQYANIEVGRPRSFSVYAPEELIKACGSKCLVESTNPNIQLLSGRMKMRKINIELESVESRPEIFYGVFKAIGEIKDEEGFIYCRIGEAVDFARVKVAEQKEKKPGRKKGKRGGFIRDILPDETSNPIQRVEYKRDIGEIRIYVRFPSVSKYLTSGLKGVETTEGKAILAELVGEAFCREIALRGFAEGKFDWIPGAEREAFVAKINELQKKYLGNIHELIANWQFV